MSEPLVESGDAPARQQAKAAAVGYQVTAEPSDSIPRNATEALYTRAASEHEADVVLLDALVKPADRLFVLRSEAQVQAFLDDSEQDSLSFPQLNSYRRRIIHKLADYYRMGHVSGGHVNNEVILYKEDYSVRPQKSLATLVPDEVYNEDEARSEDKLHITKIITRRKPATPNAKSRPGRKAAAEESKSQGAADSNRQGSGSSRESSAKSLGKCCEQLSAMEITNKGKTIEEREAEYERARAEIFQGQDDDPPAPLADSTSTSSPSARDSSSAIYQQQQQQQQPYHRQPQHRPHGYTNYSNGSRPARPQQFYCADQGFRPPQPQPQPYGEYPGASRPANSVPSWNSYQSYTQQPQQAYGGYYSNSSYNYHQGYPAASHPPMRPPKQLYDPNSSRSTNIRGSQRPQRQYNTSNGLSYTAPVQRPSDMSRQSSGSSRNSSGTNRQG